MQDKTVFASPDIAVFDTHRRDREEIILLVQEDKRYKATEYDRTNATAQLMAEVIAAFAKNNDVFENKLVSQTFYGVVMLGSRPTFYRIPMTRQFYEYVRDNNRVTNNEIRMVVDSYTPANSRDHETNFMVKEAGNVRLIFDCFERLHQLVLDARTTRVLSV